MNREEIMDAFAELGVFFRLFGPTDSTEEKSKLYNVFYDAFTQVIQQAHIYNPWFSENFVRNAIYNWGKQLSKEKLLTWMSSYPEKKAKKAKKILVVMAGNIPLVGFHDMLCVLLSGNIFIGKQSSKDKHLFPLISRILIHINSDFQNLIYWKEDVADDFDAIIATGSNQSHNYFVQYFSKYPHILRKNRNSVAVLSGQEKEEDINKLADDIFMYYGLGCRNVSKLLVPENYDFTFFFSGISTYNFIINHNKYANNYEYHRTIFLLNKVAFFDNGFLNLKQDKNIASPVGMLYYDYYNDIKKANRYLKEHAPDIQCIVALPDLCSGSVMFGSTQEPALHEYADGTDTMNFLLTL